MSLLVRTCSTDRINASRIIARAAIILGGLLWAVMLFAQASTQKYADLTYSFNEVAEAGENALIPLLITVGVFALALYYERLAAAVLFVAAGAVIVWGVIAGWEMVVWASVMMVLALPMMVSGALLLLAASTQRVCELEAHA